MRLFDSTIDDAKFSPPWITREINELAASGLDLAGRHPALLYPMVTGNLGTTSLDVLSNVVVLCDQGVTDCRCFLTGVDVAVGAFRADLAQAYADGASAEAALAGPGLFGTRESLSEQHARASSERAVAYFDRRMKFIQCDIAAVEKLEASRRQASIIVSTCREEAARLEAVTFKSAGVVAEGIALRRMALENQARENEVLVAQIEAELHSPSKAPGGRTVLAQGHNARAEEQQLRAHMPWAVEVVLRARPLISAKETPAVRISDCTSKVEEVDRARARINDVIDGFHQVRIAANRAGAAVRASSSTLVS